jgi:arsenate reductase-like glutaredoxin family protein
LTKTPPPRALLEQHIDDDRYLEYVSTRSPVFKERPLPRSKKEAIDLMLKQPNLIKRPLVVKGSRAVFGFDKDAFTRLS